MRDWYWVGYRAALVAYREAIDVHSHAVILETLEYISDTVANQMARLTGSAQHVAFAVGYARCVARLRER